jgi:RNA polymerase sigma factor (sigma-70 family)
MSSRTGQSVHGAPGGFPATRISAIVAASSGDREERARGWRTLVAAYWMPVYKYIRLKWGKPREEASDLAQGFFAEAIEKNFFGDYDPARARFRTYLRRCLDGYCANQERAARRIKRGGEVEILPLDLDDAELELAGVRLGANQVEEYFDREFARSLFTLALSDLREELHAAGKGLYMELFERYALDDDAAASISYKDLAAQYGIPVTSVTNHLSHARREFRRLLLEKLRELTATDEEFRGEARSLLGVEPE